MRLAEFAQSLLPGGRMRKGRLSAACGTPGPLPKRLAVTVVGQGVPTKVVGNSGRTDR